jgi:hypothetical protein
MPVDQRAEPLAIGLNSGRQPERGAAEVAHAVRAAEIERLPAEGFDHLRHDREILRRVGEGPSRHRIRAEPDVLHPCRPPSSRRTRAVTRDCATCVRAVNYYGQSPLGARRQATIEPRLGQGPFALDRSRRYLERFGRLGDVESGEESEFDDAALPGVDGGQCFERLIEGEHVHARRLSSGRHVLQTHDRGAAATLFGMLPAGVIDEDLTHQLRRHRKKVRPVLQRQSLHVHEPQVDLVHERRRLEGVAWLFSLEMAARHAAQLVIHERDQAVERCGVALAPGQQQVSYIVHARQSAIG